MMLICGSVISQTATQQKSNPKETNLVCIDTSIARKVANDLVSGDVCKQKLKIVSTNLSLRTQEVKDKDLIIEGLEKEKSNLNLIIKKDAKALNDQIKISNTFESDLSKQKNTTLIYKILSFLGVVSTTILILRH